MNVNEVELLVNVPEQIAASQEEDACLDASPSSPCEPTSSLSDLFTYEQENSFDFDETEELILIEDGADEAFGVQIELDADELIFDSSDIELIREPEDFPIVSPSPEYIPPAYYDAYPTFYGAPYGTFTQPSYTGLYQTAPPSVASVGASEIPSNASCAATEPMPNAPASDARRDAVRNASSLTPPASNVTVYPTPPAPSDDPLSAALTAALYSADVASASALLQAQRCGFDEIFHESWLEEE